MKRTRTITTREEHEVNRQDIIELMARRGVDVPSGAQIYVRVPGGGDWSNTNLDIDPDTPIKVEFSTTVIE